MQSILMQENSWTNGPVYIVCVLICTQYIIVHIEGNISDMIEDKFKEIVCSYMASSPKYYERIKPGLYRFYSSLK